MARAQAAFTAPLVECARNVVARYVESVRAGTPPPPPVSCVAYTTGVPAQPPDGAGGRCMHRVRPVGGLEGMKDKSTGELPAGSKERLAGYCSLTAAPGAAGGTGGEGGTGGAASTIPTLPGLKKRAAKGGWQGEGRSNKEGGKVPGAAGAARALKRAEAADGASVPVAAPAYGDATMGAAPTATAANNWPEPREHAGRCTRNGFRTHGVAAAPNCTFVGSRHWRPPASEQVPSLIVGLCAKDVRAPLEAHSMAWLEGLGRLFARDAFGVFVYWDDDGDADGTRGVLRAWARRNRQVQLLLAPPLRAPEYYRTQRLALCHNVLLGEAVARLPAHGTLAFYDLDCRVASYAPLLMAARLLAESPPSWDVLTANSAGPYYDQWALRSSLLGLDYDCQFDHRARTRAACKDVAIQIDPLAPPFGVRSAFNGVAVYRAGALHAHNATGCRFQGSRLSRNCEHVPFATCLRDAGLRVGVLPSMVADCGVPPLRGPFDRAKVRTRVFANGSVHQLEARHRMPLHQDAAAAKAPTAKDAAREPPPWERWETAGVDST